MTITGGFGITIDVEHGKARRWFIARDGIKRWLDNGEPVQKPLNLDGITITPEKERGTPMETLDLDEAAEFLKMNAEVLRRKAKNSQIPGRKAGKRWIFIREHLADWVSGRYP